MAHQRQQGFERDSTKRNKRAVLEGLKETGSVVAACKGAGVHPTTYYQWLKKDEKFRKEIEELDEVRPHLVADVLYVRARGGDIKAIKYYLDHKHPDFRKETTNKSVHIHHHTDPKQPKYQPGTLPEVKNTDISHMLWAEEVLVHHQWGPYKGTSIEEDVSRIPPEAELEAKALEEEQKKKDGLQNE